MSRIACWPSSVRNIPRHRHFAEIEFSSLHRPTFAPNLDHVSDESTSTNQGSQGAPSSFANHSVFKKKKTKKDPLANLLMMVAVLGIIASVVSVVVSFLFVGAN